MPVYLYKENVSPRDRFENLELSLDTGETAIIRRGLSYSLTTNEYNRARSFVVLDPVGGTPTSQPTIIERLPIFGTPNDGDVPIWSSALGAFYTGTVPGGGGGGGGGTSFIATDSGELVKRIDLTLGTRRTIPIPETWVSPATPTGVGVVIHVSSVRVTWTSVGTASEYIVYRDSVELGRSPFASYTDATVVTGQTYQYRVQAVDQYGQRSALSSQVVAFVNPALNIAPVAVVRAWPLTMPSNGQQLVRLNASDEDGQVLTLAMTPSAGTLATTADPSVWTRSTAGAYSATGTATDPLAASDSDTLAISAGGATGLRTIRRSLYENRVEFASPTPGFSDELGPRFGPPDSGYPTGPMTLSLPFTMLRNANVTGCRFYKAPLLAGTVPFAMWGPTGTLLSSVDVVLTVDEGGWQEVDFGTPVSVTNGTEYSIGYLVPSDDYAITPWAYNSQDVVTYPFRVKQFTVSGGTNGNGSGLVSGASLTWPNTTARSPHGWYIDPIAEWTDTTPANGPGYFNQWVNS